MAAAGRMKGLYEPFAFKVSNHPTNRVLPDSEQVLPRLPVNAEMDGNAGRQSDRVYANGAGGLDFEFNAPNQGAPLAVPGIGKNDSASFWPDPDVKKMHCGVQGSDFFSSTAATGFAPLESACVGGACHRKAWPARSKAI